MTQNVGRSMYKWSLKLLLMLLQLSQINISFIFVSSLKKELNLFGSQISWTIEHLFYLHLYWDQTAERIQPGPIIQISTHFDISNFMLVHAVFRGFPRLLCLRTIDSKGRGTKWFNSCWGGKHLKPLFPPIWLQLEKFMLWACLIACDLSIRHFTSPSHPSKTMSHSWSLHRVCEQGLVW